MSEADTQKAIIDLIHARGGVAIRVNSGMQIIKDGVGTRVFRGAERGTSDIIACYNGHFIAIEVKYGRGKPTSEQNGCGIYWRVRDTRGYFLVAWDTETVNNLLNTLSSVTKEDL